MYPRTIEDIAMRNHSTLRRTAVGAAIALTAGLAGAMLVAAPAQAAIIPVTTAADAVVPPAGSLREAILSANANAGPDQIEFAPGLGTISLVADLPVITQTLNIIGPAGGGQEISIVSPNDTFVVGPGIAFSLVNADIDTSNAMTGNGVNANGSSVFLSNVSTLGYPGNGVVISDGDLNVTLSNLSNNGDAGVWFTGVGGDDSIQITSSDLSNNEYGARVNVAAGSDLVSFFDVEAKLNDSAGLYVTAVNVTGQMGFSSLNLSENTIGLQLSSNNSDSLLLDVLANDNLSVGLLIDDRDSAVKLNHVQSDRNGLVSLPGTGAGVFFTMATSAVEIDDLSAIGNRALFGGGVGVYTMTGVSTFDIADSEIRDNQANASGGGVYFGQVNSSGATGKQVTFTNVEVTGNTALGQQGGGGGGLYVDDFGAGVAFQGGIDIIRSSFLNNTSVDGDGGGIRIDAFVHSTDGSPIIDIDSSTIAGNRAPEGSGGGLFLAKGQDTLDEAVIAIENSTISGNTAFFGGAAWVAGNAGNDDQVRIYSDSNTIVGNTAPNVGGFLFEGSLTEFTLYNSILANNAGGDLLYENAPPASVLIVNYSNVRSAQPNLAASINAGTGNQVGIDPLLGPLADNGGPTLTHLPQPGSPVFDAGDPAFAPPPAFDQRGEARVITRIDMGSVESPKTFKLADTGSELSPVIVIGALLLLLAGAALVATPRAARRRS
jgi:CSLREA domain-containing protein